MGTTPTDLLTVIDDLATAHGLELDTSTITVNEMGLDFRVAIARAVDDQRWVLRIPRRAEVMERAEVEGRVLAMVAPRLEVDVPDWRSHTDTLIAYPLLPGQPGLDLDESGEPIWRVDVSSPGYATSLGDLIGELHAIDPSDAAGTGIEVRTPDAVRQAWRDDIAEVTENFEVAEELTTRWATWLDDDRHWPDHTVLTHGEIYPGHTLVTDEHITGVLDWTTALVGDPAKDFVFHRATASDAAFELTVQRYEANGGQVWPGFADHCAEMYAASAVSYGIYALRTGEPEHRAAAAEQLNPSSAPQP